MKKGKYIKCDNCGKQIYRPSCYLKAYKLHFCSTKCRQNHFVGNKSPMFGKKHNNETRRKISLAHRGKVVSSETRKKLSKINIGKELSSITKGKIGKASLNRHWSIKSRKKLSKSISGTNHHNWRGGKSFEPWGIDFDMELKNEIRRRDNYMCQICYYTEEQLGYKLSVHHIDYNKKNNKKNNLICLCKSCHSKTGFSRKDWSNYFSKIIQ